MKFLFLSILLATMCTHTFANTNSIEGDKQKTVEIRSLLTGKWCGNKYLPNGDYQIWTVNRYVDGTYEIDFTLIKKDGTQSAWGEYGIWGIRHPIYFTAARGFKDKTEKFAADTTSADLYDAFTIESVTNEDFTYTSLTSGNTFTVRKNCN